MAVYDETKGSQSNTKDAANTSRSVSSAHACLPPLLQVHLVGLESTALQKRLAHAAAYWMVGWKRCVFCFCFFLRQTQKQTTNQTRARTRQDEREDKPEHASSVVS